MKSGKYTVAVWVNSYDKKSGRSNIYKYKINNFEYSTSYSTIGAVPKYVLCKFMDKYPDSPILLFDVDISCIDAKNLYGIIFKEIPNCL